MWYEQIPEDVTIGGLGSIGSYLSHALASMTTKLNWNIYEMDAVEDTNLAGQFYKSTQIRTDKVNATITNIREFRPGSFTFNSLGKCVEDCLTTPIVFSGFDNMLARKYLFESWVKNGEGVFIDGRMSFTDYAIFVVLPIEEHINAYRAAIVDDSKIEQPLCTLKMNTFMAMQVASKMAEFFSIYLEIKAGGFKMLPFKYEYGSGNNYLTTKYYDREDFNKLSDFPKDRIESI